jgi:hypothetical protein
METAVEWLQEKWLKYDLNLGKSGFNLLLKQAQEMEKDQICEAYAIGGSPLLGPWEFGEEYYNNTFKSE